MLNGGGSGVNGEEMAWTPLAVGLNGSTLSQHRLKPT
jgi:hypothetical protein